MLWREISRDTGRFVFERVGAFNIKSPEKGRVQDIGSHQGDRRDEERGAEFHGAKT